MSPTIHEEDTGCSFYEEALATARSASTREMDDEPDPIAYVAFVPELRDFCLCELVFRDGTWIRRCRVLKSEERLPGEEISDAAIHAFVARKRYATATDLYRALHGVDRAEAVAAIKRLRAAIHGPR